MTAVVALPVIGDAPEESVTVTATLPVLAKSAVKASAPLVKVTVVGKVAPVALVADTVAVPS